MENCKGWQAPAGTLPRLRARAGLGARGQGAGRGRLGLDRIAGGAASQEEAPGLGGEEYARRVMGEKDSDCCRNGKPCSGLMGYNSG
jgi:hypothetical protein